MYKLQAAGTDDERMEILTREAQKIVSINPEPSPDLLAEYALNAIHLCATGPTREQDPSRENVVVGRMNRTKKVSHQSRTPHIAVNTEKIAVKCITWCMKLTCFSGVFIVIILAAGGVYNGSNFVGL